MIGARYSHIGITARIQPHAGYFLMLKVSDDDDDENGVNLAQFDTNLIEIPSDSPRIGPPAGKAMNGIQYKADGAIFYAM